MITIDAPGGGGYGHPGDRDPDLVAEDVLQGYVSIMRAKEEYGVVINPETLTVDAEATEILRKKGPA